MSAIVELQEEILQISARIRETERILAQFPRDKSLLLTLKSAQRQLHALEEEFEIETDKLGVDVCLYRMFSDDDEYRVYSVFQAVQAFQLAVSTTFSALSSGQAKKKGKVGTQVAAATAFNFGYSFPGSLGFALTIPNQRRLLGESLLDQSIQTIFNIAESQDSTEVAQFARILGPAPIRAVYNWAHFHAKAKLGADIQWRRGSEVRSSLMIQSPQLFQLYSVIEMAGGESRIEMITDGALIGVNTRSRTFEFESDDGLIIKGRFSDAISITKPSQVPKRYRVVVEKTSKIRYSMEEEEVTYQLIRLTST